MFLCGNLWDVNVQNVAGRQAAVRMSKARIIDRIQDLQLEAVLCGATSNPWCRVPIELCQVPVNVLLHSMSECETVLAGAIIACSLYTTQRMAF